MWKFLRFLAVSFYLGKKRKFYPGCVLIERNRFAQSSRAISFEKKILPCHFYRQRGKFIIAKNDSTLLLIFLSCALLHNENDGKCDTRETMTPVPRFMLFNNILAD